MGTPRTKKPAAKAKQNARKYKAKGRSAGPRSAVKLPSGVTVGRVDGGLDVVGRVDSVHVPVPALVGVRLEPGVVTINPILSDAIGDSIKVRALLKAAVRKVDESPADHVDPVTVVDVATPATVVDVGHLAPGTRAVVEAFIDAVGSADLGDLDDDAAAEAGRSAARHAIAATRWSQIVGDRIDTTTVTEMLGVSRQALAKRQRSGSVLGLPGRSTTWYPTWQFDLAAKQLRPQTRVVIGTFRDVVADHDVDPFVIASWANTPQSEDLDGATPAAWISDGGDDAQLATAAQRAAARLAQ